MARRIGIKIDVNDKTIDMKVDPSEKVLSIKLELLDILKIENINKIDKFSLIFNG